jgi:Membrane protein involved in the export of O-antigen and teichoic acid
MAAVYPRLSSHGSAGSPSLTATIAGVLGFLMLPLALGGAAVSDQLVSCCTARLSPQCGHPRDRDVAAGDRRIQFGGRPGARGAQPAAHGHARRAADAAFNVAANIVLLPTVGIVGAAVAVAAAEVLTAISFSVADRSLAATAGREYAPNLLPAAIAAGAVLAARALWSTPLGVNIAIGAVVYIVLALVLPTNGARRVIEALRTFRQRNR